jgi:nucleoside-diphosphate-sugar epimerase
MAGVRGNAYFNSPDGPKVDFDKGYDLTRSDLEEKWAENRIIVAGCQGQIGVPLVRALCESIGADRVLATDVTE